MKKLAISLSLLYVMLLSGALSAVAVGSLVVPGGQSSSSQVLIKSSPVYSPQQSSSTYTPSNGSTYYPSNRSTYYPSNGSTYYPSNRSTYYPSNGSTSYSSNGRQPIYCDGKVMPGFREIMSTKAYQRYQQKYAECL